MTRHSRSISSQILARLRGEEAGWVFTPADFFDLGPRVAVASALMRLRDEGEIQRVARGLYSKPRHHPKLGNLRPSLEAVVATMERRDGVRFQPTGAHAANLLHLTDQVPARVTYLTDGPSRTIRVGPMVIILTHTTPRNMAAAGRLSGLLIQAFRNLGPRHVTPEVLARLRANLPEAERRKVLRDLLLAPEWMRAYLREVARPDA